MGLDNGIIIRGRDVDHFREYAAPYFDNKEVECYWRKQWAFRTEVVEYLCGKYDSDLDTYDWTLDSDDITKIRKIIQNYFSREYWDMESASRANPWSYAECIDGYARNLQVLAFLEDYLREFPNAELEFEFYDSY